MHYPKTYKCYFQLNKLVTRMHPSRMRTVCNSNLQLRGAGGVCLTACWDTPTRPGSGPPGSGSRPGPGPPLRAWTWTYLLRQTPLGLDTPL